MPSLPAAVTSPVLFGMSMITFTAGRARSGRRRVRPLPMRIRHLFLHSGNSVHGVIMPSMTVQRWTDAQEKLECVTEIVAVVAIERIGAVIDGELGAETDIYPLAV